MDPKVQEQRLSKLQQDRDWSNACFNLVNTEHWQRLKAFVTEQRELVKEQLISGQIKDERLEVVAARAQSRLDLLQEVEHYAKQLESREEKLEEFLKTYNSR